MRSSARPFARECSKSWVPRKRSSRGCTQSSRVNLGESAAMPVAVLNAGQLVTLVGPKGPRVRDQMRELAIIADGGMLIEDGRVIAAGSSKEIGKALPPG